MLISIFGTPSPLTYWTLHAVRVMMRAVDPDTGFLQAVRFADLQPGWSSLDVRSRKSVVLFSDCPESAISDLLLCTGLPVMLVADEPEDFVAFVAASRGLRVEQALRFASQCICTLSALRGTATVWLVGKELYHDRVANFIESISSFFRVELRSDDKQAILGQLIADGVEAPGARVGDEVARIVRHACWPGKYTVFDVAGQALVRSVAGEYRNVLTNSSITKLKWPREMFLDGDNPHSPLSGAQCMVGPARTLTFGPYLHLPRGSWDVRVEIEIARNHSGNRMFADVLSGGDATLAAITASLPVEGVFTFEMSFEVVEPFNPIEIRCMIQQGAIEGTFLLRSVELTPSHRSMNPPWVVGNIAPSPELSILTSVDGD
jgi:hypothetical protein